MPGVRTVDVDFETKEAAVTMAKEGADTAALLAALKKAGYDATVKGAPPP